MKRYATAVLVAAFVGLVAGTFWFLWVKSRHKPVVFETETPQIMDVVKKTVATGSIVPRKEVEIKPRVSGVLESIKVEPGMVVRQGDMIAKIQIIPNAENLSRAEAEVRAKTIALATAKRELDRSQAAFDKRILPEAELAKARSEHDMAAQALSAAENQLEIVKNGQGRGTGKTSNVNVVSTVDGM